jgi:glycosyltransferase involved in cell wall biosynthesis
MHVLMLTDKNVVPDPNAPEIGGASRQCLKLSKALSAKNIEVSIVSRKFVGHAASKTILDGVQVIKLNTLHQLFNRRGLRRLEVYFFLLRVLLYLTFNRKAFDILHCHSAYFPAFAAVLAGRMLRKPTIIKVMNSGFRNDILRLKNEKTIWGSAYMAGFLRRADRAVVLNKMAYRQLLEYGFEPGQLAIIANGVETRLDRFKTDYGLGHTARIIFVGRLDIAKGLATLFKAFEIMVKNSQAANYHLTLLGKGPLKKILEQYALSHGMAPFVAFEGEKSNVDEYLIGSDIFVLPSEAEGLSNSLLEAMAVGLPCVVSDIDGNRVLIENGFNGLTFNPGDHSGMIKAVERLREDRDLRAMLGNNARQTVLKNFDIEVTSEKYLQLYDSIKRGGSRTGHLQLT